MKVVFSQSDDGCLCSWRAELPGHGRFQGSTMAARAGHTDLPHDLAQLVVEAALGLEAGFGTWWRAEWPAQVLFHHLAVL